MAFTAEEIQNILNSNIEYHIKGQPESQAIQDRPLYNDLNANKKTFGGGGGVNRQIDGPVKGVYTSRFTGYTHDDEVSYANPANVKRWQCQWFEMNAGVAVSLTELKENGIHVVDSNTGEKTSDASDADIGRLVNLLDDKMEDLREGTARSFAEIEWRDGTQDAKVFPGITSIITTTPNVGVKFGIDCAANSWWRNRANMSIDSSVAGNQNLVNAMQKDMRQLRRYGNPRHFWYAGSDWMDAFEKELRSKGNYTLEGWANRKRIDASVADIAFKGIDIQYEPLLDDLGQSKFAYILDLNAIKLMPMQGEENKMHYPSRPPEKYVIYRAITWSGALCCNRLNTSEVCSVL